jgi:hypothetical protein
LEALKRKEINNNNTQASNAITPTQKANKSKVDDDDLDALLNAIEEHPPKKITKISLLQFEENEPQQKENAMHALRTDETLFNNISTDNPIIDNLVMLESETDAIIEQKSATSPTGLDLSSQNLNRPFVLIGKSASKNINSLPFPISIQEDKIRLDLIHNNTRAICGSIPTWKESAQDYIKVPQSLVFITRHETIGALYKLALIDPSNIPFEGTIQAQVFAKIRPHYGMALLISEFTLLFNFAPRPHAIITTRNVISLHTNIHSIDDDE